MDRLRKRRPGRAGGGAAMKLPPLQANLAGYAAIAATLGALIGASLIEVGVQMGWIRVP
jgi:hypothetical protein